MKFTEQRQSFLHFVTNVCAIVGGKRPARPVTNPVFVLQFKILADEGTQKIYEWGKAVLGRFLQTTALRMHEESGKWFFANEGSCELEILQQNFIHRCLFFAGVFTVSGIIDAFVYHGHKVIKKKMELGKLN